MRGLFALVVALGVGCGGARSEEPVIGASTGRPSERPIELTLRRAGGEWLHLGDLRGRPVILFVFATWDGVSQASLRPLSRFARHYEDVHVVGIAAQPGAEQLVDPYERALAPPFPLTYDPAGDVTNGTSPLGRIPAVPTFIALDARGLIIGRHIGFPNTNTLEGLRDRALSRGGVTTDRSPPPLLAEPLDRDP